MTAVQRALQRLWPPRFGRSNIYGGNAGGWKFILQRNVSSRPKYRTPQNFGQSSQGLEPHAWFLLVIPVSTFALGTWQIKRKYWKEELIEHMHRRLHRNPIPLPQTMEEIEKLEYCPVVMTGVFDHSRELYLGPRSQINVENHKGGEGGGLFSNSRAGFNVITAFKPSDRDYYILVNRGWVPADRKNPAHRTEGQVQGEVTIKGVIRLTENRVPFIAKNFPDKNAWIYRDVDKMAEVADTAPIFVDATEDSWVPGGPIGGQTNLSIRNEHLAYIITWYSLCAATSYMWYKKHVQPVMRSGRFR